MSSNSFIQRLLHRLLQKISSNKSWSEGVPSSVENRLYEISIQQNRPPEVVMQEFLTTAILNHDRKWQSWNDLTPREQHVAALACLGYTNKQIADRLSISVHTVKSHIRNILQKFEMHSKDELRHYMADWDFRAFI